MDCIKLKKERLKKGIPLDDQTINQIVETAKSVGMNKIDQEYIKNLIF